MSKTTFVVVLSTVVSVLAQSPYDQQAQVLRQDFSVNPDGTHNYLYETSNGIYEDQQGYSKGPELQAVQGQYQYQSPEGQLIRVSYTADENGFQPQGDHLPTPPPIPEAILRSIRYNEQNAGRQNQFK